MLLARLHNSPFVMFFFNLFLYSSYHCYIGKKENIAPHLKLFKTQPILVYVVAKSHTNSYLSKLILSLYKKSCINLCTVNVLDFGSVGRAVLLEAHGYSSAKNVGIR